MCEPESDAKMWADESTLDSNGGPTFLYTLEEDVNRKEQLASFRDENSDARRKTALHRENEQQLLEEGQLARSEFSARLERVTFGSFQGQRACLILFSVDFCPRNRSWFRFRKANVEALFQAEQPRADASVDDEGSSAGPLICEFYPRLIRGHVRSIAETYGFSVSGSLPPITTTNISATWSLSKPKESAHLLHGCLIGEGAIRVRWTVNENEASKSGVYERLKFAVIVRHADQAQFSMALRIRATTLGGLSIVGNGGSRIIFRPNQRHDIEENSQQMGLPWLNGGSIWASGQSWMPAAQRVDGQKDLAEENLEDLTQMEAVLLGRHGPGAPPVDKL
ncbi:uncharacterized protein K444DRAFT_608421 [Hyaloscypha bicolor E]|uniref:Uncharacterized protein n=1 Tax=Hyaloscypha bicolor E TaxID=1095630 RepID=A0A2J6TP08_9HELO|nr:uncharacterized protein K444DRAFT_608421 [Hyaloscypha bicolor E]PMD64749.1 hypothetical protein K444DRAFT_608421 [Hyaloscypha bicolor E]